jgi:transcriptional activator SPT7
MEQPPPFEAVSIEVANEAIGIVQEFFLNKIREHNDEPLIEDDELPQKQRFPKPRLPPSGKITSPRKRPPKEQAQLAKKKRKLEEGREEVIVNGVATVANPVGKLKLDPPATNAPIADPEKDDDATGMMSPPDSM